MTSVEASIAELLKRAADVTTDNLRDLAEIHGRLQAMASPEGSGGHESVARASSQLERLAEQLVFGDTPDLASSLAELVRGIGELKELVASAAGSHLAVLASAGGAASPGGTTATQEPSWTAGAAVGMAGHDACEDQILSSDDISLVHDFVGEAGQHIETAEASVLRLEDNPRDVEAINAVFRSFHTVKGVAGFLNLKQIGQLAHASENLLDLLRTGQMQLTESSLDVILCAIDALKALVGRVAEAARTGSPLKADPNIYNLIRVLGEAALPAAAGRPSSAPPGERAPCSAAEAPTSISAATSGTPEKAIDTAPATTTATTSPGATIPSAAITSTVSTKSAAGSTAEATVKVSTSRLDTLINTVGELVIAQAMVNQGSRGLLSSDPRFARDLSQMAKITRELQDISMSMRMVPIQGVFQKMGRLVRDLAKKTGKEIDLILEGGETEMDRNLVEAITDPLVHMVRNSADHGIEMPDVRAAAGKPRTGRVTLKAYHQGGSIVIEIGDDGRGLNKARLLSKAIAAGIVNEGQTLSESDIFKLIFHAGLSTAEKVTDVSGRGVGMDVVKKNVESLRGRIDIASEEGKGATFSIRLPLTLAVIDGLVVKVGGQRYILPILSVEQSLRPRADQLSTIQGRGEMCMVRDSLLPVYRLHRMLGVSGAREDATNAIAVIVQDDVRRCCMLVDELLGQQQVVIKSLGDGIGGIGNLRGFSGGAILGDGNVSLILDVPGLIDMASRN